MKFYVNPYSADRQTPPRTTIHLATCSSVKKYGHHRKWEDFDTWEDAHERARDIARKNDRQLHCCKQCNPGPFAS